MDVKMQTNYHLPEDIAKNLICDLCYAYLSCAPVKLRQESFTCGRCSTTGDDNGIPQIAFEIAMKNFSFPCKYDKQGCSKRVLFNYNDEHESKCPYRTLPCPALNCDKSLRGLEIYHHFQQDHNDYLTNDNTIKVDLFKSTNYNLIMNDAEALLVIKYAYNAKNKSLQLSVNEIEFDKTKMDKYTIQFFYENSKEALKSFPNMSCFPYRSPKTETGKFNNISLNSFLPSSNVQLTLFLKITFSKSVPTDQTDEEIEEVDRWAKEEEEEKSRILLFKAYCDECGVKGYPHNGNTCNCSQTAPKHEYREVPCRWVGCKYIGNKFNIANHNQTCPFKLYICPFLQTCPTGLFKLNSFSIHHLETHAQHCPDPNKIILPLYNPNVYFTQEKLYKYFTLLNNTVVGFLCTVKASGDWSISCSASDRIKADVYFTHDHCRFITKGNSNTFRSASIKKNNFSFLDCFAEFPRLNAVFKIEDAKEF